jgi:hypothetical protein
VGADMSLLQRGDQTPPSFWRGLRAQDYIAHCYATLILLVTLPCRSLTLLRTVWVENFEAINFHSVSLVPQKLNPTNFDLAVQLLSHGAFQVSATMTGDFSCRPWVARYRWLLATLDPALVKRKINPRNSSSKFSTHMESLIYPIPSGCRKTFFTLPYGERRYFSFCGLM